ncbi:MAG: hypothetical protein JXL67_05920, partial [Calditrichaeota bacterium]|nr:hypothetical protein [Calditrichota bacterium]
KARLEELNTEIKRLEEQLGEYRRELDEITRQTQEEESKLLEKREDVLRDIDKRYQWQYERIRKAKDGLAVVPVKKNSCGGCFSAIPPQKIVEIREMNRLYTCEHCGRILVWMDQKE